MGWPLIPAAALVLVLMIISSLLALSKPLVWPPEIFPTVGTTDEYTVGTVDVDEKRDSQTYPDLIFSSSTLVPHTSFAGTYSSDPPGSTESYSLLPKDTSVTQTTEGADSTIEDSTLSGSEQSTAISVELSTLNSSTNNTLFIETSSENSTNEILVSTEEPSSTISLMLTTETSGNELSEVSDSSVLLNVTTEISVREQPFMSSELPSSLPPSYENSGIFEVTSKKLDGVISGTVNGSHYATSVSSNQSYLSTPLPKYVTLLSTTEKSLDESSLSEPVTPPSEITSTPLPFLHKPWNSPHKQEVVKPHPLPPPINHSENPFTPKHRGPAPPDIPNLHHSPPPIHHGSQNKIPEIEDPLNPPVPPGYHHTYRFIRHHKIKSSESSESEEFKESRADSKKKGEYKSPDLQKTKAQTQT